MQGDVSGVIILRLCGRQVRLLETSGRGSGQVRTAPLQKIKCCAVWTDAGMRLGPHLHGCGDMDGVTLRIGACDMRPLFPQPVDTTRGEKQQIVVFGCRRGFRDVRRVVTDAAAGHPTFWFPGRRKQAHAALGSAGRTGANVTLSGNPVDTPVPLLTGTACGG